MSLARRREYLQRTRERYHAATSRKEQSRILDEVVATTGYHRKYALQVLGQPARRTSNRPARRKRASRYLPCLYAVQMVWEALDYPCAERLPPVLVETAQLLVQHGELHLPATVETLLTQLSRATLARQLVRWDSPKARRTASTTRAPRGLLREVPIGRYAWDEARPGALELDLVAHNGGNSSGHFAYTLSVTGVVTHYSRRRAVLGRGQHGIHQEVRQILVQWPYPVWALHTDNGSEFLNDQLLRFTRDEGLEFTRSRPYRKNDRAHVEQKNRQYVREIVGYQRYDSLADLAWLNRVYGLLDPYANLFLPVRKVTGKERVHGHLRKSYDQAKTPFQRCLVLQLLHPARCLELEHQSQALNPIELHRQLEQLLLKGPSVIINEPAAN